MLIHSLHMSSPLFNRVLSLSTDQGIGGLRGACMKAKISCLILYQTTNKQTCHLDFHETPNTQPGTKSAFHNLRHAIANFHKPDSILRDCQSNICNGHTFFWYSFLTSCIRQQADFHKITRRNPPETFWCFCALVCSQTIHQRDHHHPVCVTVAASRAACCLAFQLHLQIATQTLIARHPVWGR